MPNDECHDRPSSREWGPATAEALSGRATSAGKQRHDSRHWPLAIGHSLVIGYWPPRWFDQIFQWPWMGRADPVTPACRSRARLIGLPSMSNALTRYGASILRPLLTPLLVLLL